MRAGNFASLDLDQLIDEIESMGKSEQRELENRLEVLLMHLLKWQYQPNFRSKSWQLTIKEQRKRIIRHLAKNPSLHNFAAEIYQETYEYAVLAASRETGMDEASFAPQCPWTFGQALDADFWPQPQENEDAAPHARADCLCSLGEGRCAQKSWLQGAKRSRAGGPASICNAAGAVFGCNPKGMAQPCGCVQRA